MRDHVQGQGALGGAIPEPRELHRHLARGRVEKMEVLQHEERWRSRQVHHARGLDKFAACDRPAGSAHSVWGPQGAGEERDEGDGGVGTEVHRFVQGHHGMRPMSCHHHYHEYGRGKQQQRHLQKH